MLLLRWPRLLLLVGLLAASPRRVRSTGAAAGAGASDPDCGDGVGSRSRYRALVCWLWKAELSLPDDTFQEGLFTLKVRDMTCTQFQVAALASSLPASYGAAASAAALEVSARGVSARCTGTYGASFMSGSVVATVGGASDGGPSLKLRAGVAAAPLGNATAPSAGDAAAAALPFPTHATLSSCQPDFLVSQVDFSGSASAHVIGLFSGTIAKKVTAAMNENICALIKKNGESKLDGYLGSARQYIGGLLLENHDSSMVEDTVGGGMGDAVSAVSLGLAPEDGDSRDAVSTASRGLSTLHKQATQTTENAESVGWDRSMPFLKRLLLGLNDVVSQHLDEGVILKALQTLGTWQSLTAAECEDCGFFFKGANGLVGSLTGGAGALEIPVPATFLDFHRNHTFAIPNYGDITLTARTVKISGIDQLTDLVLLRPEGQNMLTSSIASRAGFDVSVLLDLEVRPVDGSVFHSDTLNETFELHFNTSDLSLQSSSAWDLDHEIFDRLNVGSFMYGSYTVFDNHRNVLNCVVEALQSVVVRSLRGSMTLDAVRVSSVVPAPAAGTAAAAAGLEDDVDALANDALRLLLAEYPATTTAALAGLIATPARHALNNGLVRLIGDTKKKPLHCVNVEMPKDTAERPLRLDGNKALKLFNDVVNDNGNVAVVNSFIGCVEKITTANKLLAGHLYNLSVGDLTVVLHDLQLENADSVYELELLKPEASDHYRLASDVGFGTCAAAADGAEECTTTSLSFGTNVVHSTRGNLGNINVHIKVKNWKLEGGTELKLDMNYLPHLLISDLLARPQCLTIPLTAFALDGLNSTVELLEVTVDVALSSQDDPRSFAYRTGDATELARDVSTLMSQGSVFLQEALGDQVATHFREARNVCETPVNPHQGNSATRSTQRAGVWTLLIVLAFVVGNAWLFLRGFKGEEQEALFSGDENAEGPTEERQESGLNEPLLNEDDDMDANLEVETPRRKFPLSSSSSLMYHPSIHPAIKYAFPATLALAFLLFLSSNISVGASVDLLVTRANGENLTSLINIYSFSLTSTIRGMFQAGVYLLMLLVLSCSGIWPYAKLVLMMASWIASTRRLPPIKREKILYLLDSLGKFSLVDVYVLVLMMVAFRYNLEVESVGEVNVYVAPQYGFYAFLFATILSLVAGHVALFLHRKTMLPSIPVYSGRRESLAKHVFDDKRGRGLVKLTKRFRRTVVFALFLTSVLICVGVGLKSFHFEFNGVAGTALGDAKIRSFSLVSIGAHIPQSVQESASFGVHWIQTCYFFFALVMPIVCLLSVLVLFLIPMRLKQQQMVFMLAEVANAWSAIEVFVLAIVISLIEIAPFAESMVGSRCAVINNILSGWSGGDGGDDMQYCFGVKSSLDGSSAVLIIGVLLNSLLVSVLHRFAHHSLAERIEREDRPDATDDENKTVQDCVLAHTFVSSLRSRPRLGAFIFEEVSFGPHGEYSIDFENVAEQEEEAQEHTSNNFWSEWRKIVSVV